MPLHSLRLRDSLRQVHRWEDATATLHGCSDRQWLEAVKSHWHRNWCKGWGFGWDLQRGTWWDMVGHGGTWWDMVGHGGTWWHAVGWSGFVDFFPLQSSSGTVLRVVCCGSKKLKTWKAMRPSGHAELPGLGAGVLCDASWSLQGQAWPGELRPHLVRQVAHQTSAGRLELLPANPWQGAGRYDSA